MTKRRQTKL